MDYAISFISRELVADKVGKDAIPVFRMLFAGAKLSVPTTLRPCKISRELRKAASERKCSLTLGDEIFKWLVSEYGGLNVAIFSASDYVSLAKWRRAVVLSKPHETANSLAIELGISARRVEQIRKEGRARLASERQRTKRAREVVRYVRGNTERTNSDIAEALGVTEQTVARARQKICDDADVQ